MRESERAREGERERERREERERGRKGKGRIGKGQKLQMLLKERDNVWIKSSRRCLRNQLQDHDDSNTTRF